MMTRQMVICTIDHTDGGNLLKDQTEHTLILKFIYGTFRVGIKSKLKSELKLSNMYAYGKLISLHSENN